MGQKRTEEFRQDAVPDGLTTDRNRVPTDFMKELWHGKQTDCARPARQSNHIG
ncbi:hypothetical protein ACOXXX_18815 [Thalassococcus sp. BH17M4-6]|uniref:hypothetical protein n=1 Tax=Thalassococcus sp. BH17M4-6 TaxID=3413148 RepID=UPI003BEA4CC3